MILLPGLLKANFICRGQMPERCKMKGGRSEPSLFLRKWFSALGQISIKNHLPGGVPKGGKSIREAFFTLQVFQFL